MVLKRSLRRKRKRTRTRIRRHHEASSDLKRRESNFLSASLEIPTGPVDLAAIDVAEFVNRFASDTHYTIPRENYDSFNARYRRNFFVQAAARGAEAELAAWLETGLSNGRGLKLQLMALKPMYWFKLHAHPNMEFEATLVGSLREVRLKGPPPTTDFATRRSCKLQGPVLSGPLEFEEGAVSSGKFLVNPTGSVHQSFTGEDGALILVLWSGCHATIPPERCAGLTGPGAQLLKPGAGWANTSKRQIM